MLSEKVRLISSIYIVLSYTVRSVQEFIHFALLLLTAQCESNIFKYVLGTLGPAELLQTAPTSLIYQHTSTNAGVLV